MVGLSPPSPDCCRKSSSSGRRAAIFRSRREMGNKDVANASHVIYRTRGGMTESMRHRERSLHAEDASATEVGWQRPQQRLTARERWKVASRDDRCVEKDRVREKILGWG